MNVFEEIFSSIFLKCKIQLYKFSGQHLFIPAEVSQATNGKFIGISLIPLELLNTDNVASICKNCIKWYLKPNTNPHPLLWCRQAHWLHSSPSQTATMQWNVSYHYLSFNLMCLSLTLVLFSPIFLAFCTVTILPPSRFTIDVTSRPSGAVSSNFSPSCKRYVLLEHQ